jgi:hypothetical protein
MTDAYPLAWPQGWPRMSAGGRKRAKFHASGRTWGTGKRDLTIADGTSRVVGQLRTLGVRDGQWVISSNLQLRRDGLPYSDQKAPQDPGVAVYWTRKGKQQVMAIDLYDRVADNLAAVAASLEALRAIERHGGAQILDRAFEGFTALANPDTFDAWSVMGLVKTAAPHTADFIRQRFRDLSRIYHPDVHRDGATKEDQTCEFQKLVRARDELLAKAAP